MCGAAFGRSCFRASTLAVASRSVIGIYRPLLEPLGLTHPQYLVMLALWERSPRSVKDLGTSLQLDAATLSPLLKRLETIGYVTRQRNASDERQLTVELTESGRKLRRQALKIPYAVVERLGGSGRCLTHADARTTCQPGRTAATPPAARRRTRGPPCAGR